MRRSCDYIPPAKMGALRGLLHYALCGASETAPDTDGANEFQGLGPSNDCRGEAATKGAPGPAFVHLEFQRCLCCRRGCCGNCFRRLLVRCRGPRIVFGGRFRPISISSIIDLPAPRCIILEVGTENVQVEAGFAVATGAPHLVLECTSFKALIISSRCSSSAAVDRDLFGPIDFKN